MTTTITTVSTPTIYASFCDASAAEKAAGALLDFGVRADDISFVSKANDDASLGSRLPLHGTPTEADRSLEELESVSPLEREDSDPLRLDTNGLTHNIDASTELAAKTGISTTTPADAAAGAIKGAGIGLGVGIAAALAAVFVPGVGLVAGAGSFATALTGAAGAAAGGAIAGGVHGYLKDQGIPDDDVVRFSGDYDAGGAILAIGVDANTIDEETVERLIAKYQGKYIGSFGVYTANA